MSDFAGAIPVGMRPTHAIPGIDEQRRAKALELAVTLYARALFSDDTKDTLTVRAAALFEQFLKDGHLGPELAD